MERITSYRDLHLAVAARPSATRQLCCRQVPAAHQESFLAKRGSPITRQFRNIYPVGNPHSAPKKVNKCVFIKTFGCTKSDRNTNKVTWPVVRGILSMCCDLLAPGRSRSGPGFLGDRCHCNVDWPRAISALIRERPEEAFASEEVGFFLQSIGFFEEANCSQKRFFTGVNPKISSLSGQKGLLEIQICK